MSAASRPPGWAAAFFAFGVLMLATRAWAQAPAPAAPQGAPPAPSAAKRTTTEMSFFSVAELSTSTSVKPEVHGARDLDTKDWPANFYGYSKASREWCTASLVGDRILLTAAHCVPNGGAIDIAGGTADCERAGDFDGTETGSTADYALCLLDHSVPGVRFERVNRDPALLKVGSQVTLTGFGCSDPGVGYGQFRGGEVTIRALPAGANNSLSVEGSVASCMGDSGGAAYVIDPVTKARFEVSVNSTVEGHYQTVTRSYLASTSTAAAKRLFDAWKKKGRFICGVHDEATGCR